MSINGVFSFFIFPVSYLSKPLDYHSDFRGSPVIYPFLNTPPIFLQFYPLAFRYHSVTILYFPNSLLEGCLPQIDVINKI